MLRQLQILLLWTRQQQPGGRTQTPGHQSQLKLTVNLAWGCSWEVPLEHLLTLQQPKRSSGVGSLWCLQAEGWVWPVHTNILWHSRPLGSQALALTLAFHISLLWFKDDYWGFRKVFMSADLCTEENFCIKTIFFQLQLQSFGCIYTTLAF